MSLGKRAQNKELDDIIVKSQRMSKAMDDLRSYGKNVTMILDGWNRRSNHKEKLHDTRSILRRMLEVLDEYENVIQP